MGESSTIIEAMRQAVPPGKAELSSSDVVTLRTLTAKLMAARPGTRSEYARFTAIRARGLCLPTEQLREKLDGATVLVTGGTGCIGSTLLAQLALFRPARLVSISRGITGAFARCENVEYLNADVTAFNSLKRVVAEVGPDIVFHTAAQRSPGLAETEVHRTVATNILGSRNVLAAASAAGVAQVVLASTGKALRPYSPEIYTASKRAAEWVAMSVAGASAMKCSAARFTHVIDNSIIRDRLLGWVAANGSGDAAIRLHGPEIAFYVQSALESAQLLLIAMLGAVPGEFRVHAIADLGWPVSLLDISLGLLAETGSATPVYVSGYDPGYEEVAFPGLYDLATAGDVSPLMNAFETAAMTAAPCPMVNSFRLEMTPDPVLPKLLSGVDDVCAANAPESRIRQALDDLSWAMLDATLAAAAPAALARCVKLTRRFKGAMSPTHERIMRAIATHAKCDPHHI